MVVMRMMVMRGPNICHDLFLSEKLNIAGFVHGFKK